MPEILIPESDIPIGFGLSIHVYPCATTPQIICDAFGDAAIKAFIGLERPTVKQSIKKITGGSWLHNIRAEIELLEIEDPAFFDAGLKLLFEFAELVDVAGWFFFLGSMGVQFLIDWSTIIYQESGCAPGTQTTIGNSNEPGSVFPRDGNWHECVTFSNVHWNNAPTSEAGSMFGCGPGEVVTCNVMQTWTDLGNVPINVQCRTRNTVTNEQTSYSYTSQDLFVPNQSTINENYHLNGGVSGGSWIFEGMSGIPGETDDAWVAAGIYYYERTAFLPPG